MGEILVKALEGFDAGEERGEVVVEGGKVHCE